MGQLFRPSTNHVARASIIGALIILAGTAWVASHVQRSPYTTDVGVAREQPVPFSHEHHVGGLGIDCRYCHTSVENAEFAGMPATKTCMSCHSQIWNNADMLEPVRASWASNTPIAWNRVHNIPDFVHFNHSSHVNKGVGCSTCHGQVDQMPLMWKAQTLQMEWCLECHRQPELYLRPQEEVFNMQYVPPVNQLELGRKLKEQYKIADSTQMTNCSVCHY
jgi:hypothetical protein